MTEPVATSPDGPNSATSPLRCFSGAFVSGSLSMLAYKLMMAIAITFANKPIASDNATAIRLSAAVRTLVVGIIALGAGVFGLAALGLFALGLQLLWQKVFRSESTTP